MSSREVIGMTISPYYSWNFRNIGQLIEILNNTKKLKKLECLLHRIVSPCNQVNFILTNYSGWLVESHSISDLQHPPLPGAF